MRENSTVKMKVCKYCHVEKSLELFEVDKRLKDGHTNRCKECRSKQRYENGEYEREKFRKHEIKSNSPTYYTAEVLQRMMSATNCTYCGDELNRIKENPKQATMDHVYHAGGYAGKNIDENIVPACRACNAAKGKDHVFDFYLRSERFTEELWLDFVSGFASRILRREPTAEDVDAVALGLAEDAADIRAGRI